MSAVEFDPREQGEVTDFEITNVCEERRTPLDFKTLIDAERKAAADGSRISARSGSSIGIEQPPGARSDRQDGAGPQRRSSPPRSRR